MPKNVNCSDTWKVPECFTCCSKRAINGGWHVKVRQHLSEHVWCNQLEWAGLSMWRDALWDDKHQILLCYCRQGLCVCVCACVCISLCQRYPSSVNEQWSYDSQVVLDPTGWQLSPAPGCRGAINMSQPEPSVRSLFLSLSDSSCLTLFHSASLSVALPLLVFPYCCHVYPTV